MRTSAIQPAFSSHLITWLKATIITEPSARLQPLAVFPSNQQDLVSHQVESMSLKKCGFLDQSHRDDYRDLGI